eukprot:13707902-Alexandrium_andersonii.AAC.1
MAPGKADRSFSQLAESTPAAMTGTQKLRLRSAGGEGRRLHERTGWHNAICAQRNLCTSTHSCAACVSACCCCPACSCCCSLWLHVAPD